MSDHSDIQNFWSPGQVLPNDASFVGLYET